MSVLAPPRPPRPAPPEPEALIEEARRRARRRRLLLAAVVLIVALAGVGAYLAVGPGGGGSARARRPGGRSVGAGSSVGPAVVVWTVPWNSGARTAIWRLRPDGSDRVRLGLGAAAAISPDGRWIAFSRESGRSSRLLLMPAAGGAARLLQRIRDGAFHPPIWSPDSRRLISQDGRATLIDVRSGARRPLAAVGAYTPSFSPDGQRIVFAQRSGGGQDLVVETLATGRTTQITHDHRAETPVWGARWIAFQRWPDVWLVRLDGTGAHRLIHTGGDVYPIAWSEDGRRLLAADEGWPNSRLWAVDVPSGRARDLTGWRGDLFPLGLSRNGRTVLAAIGCGEAVTTAGIVETIPFAGGRPHAISEAGCRASWTG